MSEQADTRPLPLAVLAARHRMLPEIGETGVARLAQSEASVDGLPAAAAAVARAYLERSAVSVTGTGTGTGTGTAAAHLRGAHFALEHLASTVGLRRPALPLSGLLELVGEVAGEGAGER